jgi:hypothetical protein
MVAAGMTPLHSLVACTNGAARQHLRRDLGKVLGKCAHLILLADAPTDIGNLRTLNSRIVLDKRQPSP